MTGHRIKPSRKVKINDCYEIRSGYERYEVIVTDVSDRRGPASSAHKLYRETEGSIERRVDEAEKRRLAMMQRPRSSTRPDKKQRRKIRQFNEKL